MQIYLIVYEESDGENHDQFVRAEDAQEAILMWRAYREDYIAEPTHVYQIPTTFDEHEPAKVLQWVEDIKLIA